MDCRSIKWTIVVFAFFPVIVMAGWGHHAHVNYLKEAIRILPCFDYEMCLYYRDALIPLYEQGRFPEQRLASNTQDIDLYIGRFNGICAERLFWTCTSRSAKACGIHS